MSDSAGENQMQGRARGAFLIVNTVKLAVIFGLLPLSARLVFRLNRLNPLFDFCVPDNVTVKTQWLRISS
jgi:hypothetical protein